MLEVRRLRVSVGGKEVLRDVSLSLRPGEVLLLTGPNGSGKTTLARAIMGDPRLKVLGGSILLDGEDITNLSPEERFRRGILVTFQNPPEFEGIKTGEFLLRIGKEDLKKLKEATKAVGLDPSVLFRELHRGFSGGEKKRLELLQALFLDPRYLVLDEVDSGVDIESVETIAKQVNRLREKGTGILYITHNPLSLQLLEGHTLLRMEGGKILENGGRD